MPESQKVRTALNKYSIGVGDRFGKQAEAQLASIQRALATGISITPVWNKSHREHTIIGSTPADTRRSVDAAVRRAGWEAPYFVDADHINLTNVDPFLAPSDFFTIDVADYIGLPADPSSAASFREGVGRFMGTLRVPGLQSPLFTTDEDLERILQKYLRPVKEAGLIYRHICNAKKGSSFVVEISTDEASDPQSPRDLFFILAAIAQEGIPVQTIAPKFSGKFLKGVDYIGSRGHFAREFEDDLHIIAFAVDTLGLPPGLKISVHSGSDKFSLYPIIRGIVEKLDAGLHLKTAGTTWLEELIGIAAEDGQGLEVAKEIYRKAYGSSGELCRPYESVVDIETSKLPAPTAVDAWSGARFAATLRHDTTNEEYNPHFRQLLHVAYGLAASMKDEYYRVLDLKRDSVRRNIVENLWTRHIRPLFVGE